jgi:cell division protein FtsI/penicillin-binding protein 2
MPNIRQNANRLLLILLFFILAFGVVSARLFYVQVVDHEFYLSKSVSQRTRMIILAADRGDILDRRGNLLATSVDTYSVYIVPEKIENKESVAAKLSKMLGVTKYSVLNKTYSSKPFVWVARKISKAKGKKVRAAGIDGVGAVVERKRLYPKGNLASQVLGFVGMDNQGLSGVELGFDKYLRGIEGKLMTESDPTGWELVGAKTREIQSPTDGLKIVLSIDEVIQYFSERELEAALKKHDADSGTVIVMDVVSGDILALASKPDFNPNKYSKYSPKRWHNRALLDVYEPGSTLKLITVAAALEENVVDEHKKIYCPPYIKIGGKTIKNAHRLEPEEENADITDILVHSINTGTAKIAMELGEEKLYSYLKAFGFGERLGVGIPGETRGILRDVESWSKPDIAVISFGQGIAVTPMQLVSAVAAIGNGGMRVRPRLVKRVESVDGSFVKVFSREELGRAVSEKTASKVRDMMVEVVERGTGKLAKVPGFKVGGKTGTAEKVKPGGFGYWRGHYIASFVGVVPMTDPRLAILVIVDDPKDVHWGEKVAAPVFASVARDALRYLNVTPDDLLSKL